MPPPPRPIIATSGAYRPFAPEALIGAVAGAEVGSGAVKGAPKERKASLASVWPGEIFRISWYALIASFVFPTSRYSPASRNRIVVFSG